MFLFCHQPENVPFIESNWFYPTLAGFALGSFVISWILLFARRGCAMQVLLLISWFAVLGFSMKVQHPISFFAGISFIFLVIWFFQLRCFVVALARDQLRNEWIAYNSEFEAVAVDPDDFHWIDRDYYAAKERELKSLGFRKMGDFELLHVSKAFPRLRTFQREFIDPEGCIFASVMQYRVLNPKSGFERNLNHNVIAFASEFTDGTFLETTNAKGVNPVEKVEKILVNQFTPATSVSTLLESHRTILENRCQSNNVDARVHRSIREMFASGAREHLIFREDRRKKGGMTEEEQRVSAHPDDDGTGALSYSREYIEQAKQIAEKERRKKDGETF